MTTTPPFPAMVPIPAATFLMGAEGFYPEERPVRRMEVDGFWIDKRDRRIGLACGITTAAVVTPAGMSALNDSARNPRPHPCCPIIPDSRLRHP